MKKSKLFKIRKESNKPLIENDKVVIGVYAKVYKYNKGILSI